MSGESLKKTGHGYARNLDARQFQPMIDSWDLHLRAEKLGLGALAVVAGEVICYPVLPVSGGPR